MLYVGIDPGESWCGFAALETTSKKKIRVEARTYSVKAHQGYLQMARDLMDIIPRGRQLNFVCEDFRIRRSGHQGFNHGDTLRLLGALEYGVASRDEQSHFFLVPPNDNGEHETKELFGNILRSYRSTWPKTYRSWGHCVSAWRVLGNHLFHHERDLLLRLHGYKKSHRCHQWLPSVARSKLDGIAPAGLWINR
jgi:hypothetical protein